MRKERIIPMMFLVIALVGVLTLPQGFAKGNQGTGGNRQTPLAIFLHAYAMRLQLDRSHPTKTYAQQSGNGLPPQGTGLPNNHLLERGM